MASTSQVPPATAAEIAGIVSLFHRSRSLVAPRAIAFVPPRFRRERAVTAAQELRVSLDWLAGLTDAPRPAAELAARCADLERRLAAAAQRQ